MSDFLYSAERRAEGELAESLALFLHGIPHTLHEKHGDWGSVCWAAVPHEPNIMMCDVAASGSDGLITIVAGAPVARLPGLSAAPLDEAPRRERLHESCRDPAYCPGDVLDGHFAVLAIDTRDGSARVTTDRAAFVAVFETTSRAGAVVFGTHVDALARAAGRAADIDAVSLADLTANEACTPPYTLYRDVTQVAAAHHVHVHAHGGAHPLHAGTGAGAGAGAGTGAGSGTASRAYWQPLERYVWPDLRAAAAALRGAMLENVAAAIGSAGHAGILLSAGEDSRAVLGAVPHGVRVDGFVYGEHESREVRVARAVAHAYGATLTPAIRAPDHYAAGFAVTAALCGSHHQFSDVHGHVLASQLSLHTLPVVLGGYSADTVLKGHYAKHAADTSLQPGVLPELHQAMVARRQRFHASIAEMRPDSAAEWARLWPLAVRKHGANVEGNRRMFRSFEPFHATAILDIAATVPLAWKRDRRLFRAAMRPFLTPSWYVPHAEYRFPWFGRGANALLFPGLAVARGVRAMMQGEARRRQRPWPKWSTLPASPLLRDAEQRLLRESPLVPLLMGDAAGGADAHVRSWNSRRRVFLLQLMHVHELAGRTR